MVPKKRKSQLPKRIKKKTKRPKLVPASTQSDDEIKSDSEAESEEGEQQIGPSRKDHQAADSESDEDETPQQKRLRLAKKYLAEIEERERARGKLSDSDEEESDIDTKVAGRLNEDYLREKGRLRKTVTSAVADVEQVRIVRHKQQKMPITSILTYESEEGERFLFTGCKNETIIRWDLHTLVASGKIVLRQHNKEAPGRRYARCIAISSDGKFLAIGDGSPDIQMWCPRSLKFLALLQGHRGEVTALVFRRNSHQLYSGSADRSVRIWSADEMTFVEALYGHQTTVAGIDTFMKERAITAGGADQSVRIWKIVEESQLVFNEGHTDSVEDVKLVDEEHFLTSGQDGRLCVWVAAKRKPIATVELAHGRASNGEANWVASIAVLFNTDLVASGSCDGAVRVWKLANGFKTFEQLFEIAIVGFVNCLAFAGEGQSLIVGVGQEHRLGRWWSNKDAKNAVHVVPLRVKSSS